MDVAFCLMEISSSDHSLPLSYFYIKRAQSAFDLQVQKREENTGRDRSKWFPAGLNEFFLPLGRCHSLFLFLLKRQVAAEFQLTQAPTHYDNSEKPETWRMKPSEPTDWPTRGCILPEKETRH
jgi:hypothetical protein